MKKERPETTLFMLASLDGKITTGDKDILDTDKDFRRIQGIREGLQQYYNLEKKTDRFSLNSGNVMAKIGVNTDKNPINCPDVNFLIIDNKHLNEKGINNLIKNTNKLYLITSNKNHPAFKLRSKLEFIYYPKKIDFKDLFYKFKSTYKIDKITIQSGGTLNAIFLREKLIDHISFVIAPCLIGGKNTSTLIDGESLHSEKDLKYIKALKLKRCEVLKDSYIHVCYDVINETKIES